MLQRGIAFVLLSACAILLCGCAVEKTAERNADLIAELDRISEAYVKLVLDVGQHDSDYVDAYYGPPEWRDVAVTRKRTLAEIRQDARTLIDTLQRMVTKDLDDELLDLRHRYLTAQLRSLEVRVTMLEGEKLTFDVESKAIYNAVAPWYPAEHFEAILAELDPLLPGQGPLLERYEAFKSAFIIPEDRLDRVFRTAIESCKTRTQQHIALPTGEDFEIEYVTGKTWSGYNWYQGGFRSLIQVNTDLPIYIDRAVDLACHEGYPGHHVYNALLEQKLVRDRGWREFSVYPLFSPQSLIAEGTANYGIDMAFPGEERVRFERETLFPLAGLDPDKAELYYRIEDKVQQLSHAGNLVARQYMNAEIDAETAAQQLMHLALMPEKRARQRVGFIDQYGAYVINYNVGQDLVAAYVERKAGGSAERRWEVFEQLLSTPRLPSGL